MPTPHFRAPLPALLIALVLAFAPQHTQAEGAADSRTMASTSAATAGFDWFANRASLSQADALALARAQLAMAQSWGNGAWICSPAGFGRGSTCYRR